MPSLGIREALKKRKYFGFLSKTKLFPFSFFEGFPYSKTLFGNLTAFSQESNSKQYLTPKISLFIY
jgi:hypothetical protein